MAIRIAEPSLQGEFSHILSTDPALDKESDGYQDAWDRFLEGTVPAPPIKNGEEPTVWHLEPLKDAELEASIRGKLDDIGMAWAVETACYCLLSVDNLSDAEGNPIKIEHERVNGFRKVSKKTRNLLGSSILNELGVICIGRQNPS